jgi:hypothetical protein
MTEKDVMEQLAARARGIIDDVNKALQGLDAVSKGYKEMGARLSEEAKHRVLLGRVKDQLVMAYNSGVVDTEKRIYGAPWEVIIVHLWRDTGRGSKVIETSVVNGRLSEGWEPWEVCGVDNSYLIMRRRVRREEVGE